MKAKLDLSKLLIVRGLSSLGGVFFAIIMSKFLGVEDFGSYSLAFSIFGFLTLVIKFGLDNLTLKKVSVIYNQSLYRHYVEFKKNTYKIIIPIYIFLVLMYYVSIPFLKNELGDDVLKLLDIYILCLLPYTILSLVCSTYKAFRIVWVYPMFEIGFILLIISILLIIDDSLGFNRSLEYYIIIQCVIITFFSLFGELDLIRRIKEKSLNSEDEINRGDELIVNWKDSNALFDFFTLSLLAYFINMGMPMLLSPFSTVYDIGVFSLSLKLAITVNFIVVIVNSIYTPVFSIHIHNRDRKNLLKSVDKSGLALFLSCIPIMIITFFLSDYIFFYLGLIDDQANNILLVLLIGQLVNVVTGSVTPLMNMSGLHRENRNITFLSMLLSLLIFFLLVIIFGFGTLGAAIALSTFWSLKNLLSAYIVQKKLEIIILNYMLKFSI